MPKEKLDYTYGHDHMKNYALALLKKHKTNKPQANHFMCYLNTVRPPLMKAIKVRA
ncbi:hypothetical protein DSUL_60033 [Desulfovibrionales bacterium]